MLDPARVFVLAFAACVVVFWLALLAWAVRSGLFSARGEAVKYTLFDDGPEAADGR